MGDLSGSPTLDSATVQYILLVTSVSFLLCTYLGFKVLKTEKFNDHKLLSRTWIDFIVKTPNLWTIKIENHVLIHAHKRLLSSLIPLIQEDKSRTFNKCFRVEIYISTTHMDFIEQAQDKRVLPSLVYCNPLITILTKETSPLQSPASMAVWYASR